MKFAAVGLVLLFVSGCPMGEVGPGDGVMCTLEFVYGLTVTVTDAAGTPVAGATLTLTEGVYSETMEELQDGVYTGAGERGGTYTLTIEADGYVTKSIEDILIDSWIDRVSDHVASSSGSSLRFRAPENVGNGPAPRCSCSSLANATTDPESMPPLSMEPTAPVGVRSRASIALLNTSTKPSR